MPNVNIPIVKPDATAEQFGRYCSLLVAQANGTALDLSALRIKFAIKTNTLQTPNSAEIRVYNVSHDLAISVKSQYKSVILNAGYLGNFGTIFRGNIKQVLIGRESQVDNYIDIICGDGEKAYNFAVVNSSISKGSTVQDQINAAVQQMVSMGVTAGGNSTVAASSKRFRGKAMFGSSKKYLRQVAETTNTQWSIQNEQVVFVRVGTYLPGAIPHINASNGMVGTPEQTTEGVNVKCLLNPYILINGAIQLDNSTILVQKVNLSVAAGATNSKTANQYVPIALPSNGIYKVVALQHDGDTRGTDWYTTVISSFSIPGV